MGLADPCLRWFGPIVGRCYPCGPLVQDSRCPALVGLCALSNGPLLDVLCRQRCSVYFCCVFCVFSCYSRLVSLQSTIHQHSWNSLVITPTTTIDVHSLCFYAGVDSIYFALKDHQQAPPHLFFTRPRAKSYVTMKHEFKKCDASIKVIPCHSSYLWIFEVSTMSP